MADKKISQLVDGGAPQATDEFVVDRAGADNFKIDWASIKAEAESDAVLDGDAAGGVLSGTYPDPGFAADMATQAELDAVSTVANAAIPSLPDPNADLILFWDDSAGAYAYLTPGTNLTITGTTLDAAGGGSQSLAQVLVVGNDPDGTPIQAATVAGGTGGKLELVPPDGFGTGGEVLLTGGDGDASSGGAVSVFAGDGPAGQEGGTLRLEAGQGNANGQGGALFEFSGNKSDGEGGGVTAKGGDGEAGQAGGSVDLAGGDGDGGGGQPAGIGVGGGGAASESGLLYVTTDGVGGDAGQFLGSDGAGATAWQTPTVRVGAGVPTGAPGVAEVPFAYDTTAVTGGFYFWDGAAWVKVATIL